MNPPDKLKEFCNFVLTFGSDYEGKGAVTNYAKFTGFSKATISKYMNDLERIHEVHFTIMRLVNEREEAKRALRQMRKQMRNRKDNKSTL